MSADGRLACSGTEAELSVSKRHWHRGA